MDGEGFVELLVELGIVGKPAPKGGFGVRQSMLAALAAEQAAQANAEARALASKLLDMTKAQRMFEGIRGDKAADQAQTQSLGASNRWIWPDTAHKANPPDFLTFEEFKRLVVRLGFDKYTHVRGVANRLKQLLFNCFR